MTPDAYDSSPPPGTPPWARVYQRGGHEAHLDDAGMIACRDPRRRDAWADESWLGTGSQAEYEHAAALPLCLKCSAARERSRIGER